MYVRMSVSSCVPAGIIFMQSIESLLHVMEMMPGEHSVEVRLYV